MDKKMIVMDLDGTLLNIDKKINSKTKDYLLDLKNKGHIVVIATGRILDSAIEISDGAKFANYVISNAGGLIYDKDKDKILFKNIIDKETVKEICSLYNDDINYIEACDLHYYHRYTAKNYYDNGYAKIIRDKNELINNVEAIHMSINLNNNLDSIFNLLKNKFKNIRPYIMADSYDCNNKWIEISGLNVNKFNAIKTIAELENVCIENVITFGDSNNDIEMIIGAGVGVAMENAIDAVKEEADYITESHNEDGVMVFLEEYLSNEKLVIFDWGGVIESHRDGEYNIYNAIETVIKRLTNNKFNGDIISTWDSCDYIDNGYEIGEINNIEDIKIWFNNVKNKFNINCTFDEFVSIYKEECMKTYYYKDVVKYAHSLRDRCKIGILSNLGYLDKERIDMQVDLKKFDYVWLSFELECRKPKEIIYKKVEEDFKNDINNILFIDDKKENIESAQKRGWNTCMAFGYELDKIKNSVDKFLGDEE